VSRVLSGGLRDFFPADSALPLETTAFKTVVLAGDLVDRFGNFADIGLVEGVNEQDS
jgi:hypothetical protein